MRWYDINLMSMVLFVIALIIGWLKGRHDFKDISKTAHNSESEDMPSPCGPWQD
jgi:hypothetical protein